MKSKTFQMFTFRGIPCIYYGSEVGFQALAKLMEKSVAIPHGYIKKSL